MDTGDKSGCLKVKLEGSVETEALLDSGADCSLISRGLVERLESQVGFLKMKTLDEPERIGTVGSDLVVKRMVCLDSLVFQTSAGPLRWRNLQCWVDESDPDQLLVVDRPTMERMGYSAGALLVEAKRKFETYGSEENLPYSERITSNARKPFVRFMRHKDEALYRSPAAEEECEFEEAMFTPLTGPAEGQQAQIIEILDQKVN
jgi:hypothetical protein